MKKKEKPTKKPKGKKPTGKTWKCVADHLYQDDVCIICGKKYEKKPSKKKKKPTKKAGKKKAVKKEVVLQTGIHNAEKYIDPISGATMYAIKDGDSTLTIAEGVYNAIKAQQAINSVAEAVKDWAAKKNGKKSGVGDMKLNKKIGTKGKVKASFVEDEYIPVKLRLKCGNYVDSKIVKHTAINADVVDGMTAALWIEIPGGKKKVKYATISKVIIKNGKETYEMVEQDKEKAWKT